MTSRQFILGMIILTLTIIISFHQGCQPMKSTSTGNPSRPPPASLAIVAMKIAAFNPSSGSNTLSQLRMCLTRLRLKAVSSANDSGDIDLSVGEVHVTPSGADLSMIQVPSGDYDRVEFDLENGCGTGESLAINNSSGIFSTTDNMTIGFDGPITVSGAKSINLLIQKIVDALAAVKDASGLKEAAESMSGGCD